MRSRREGDMSATTQVKVLSPEIILNAMGQGFHFPEANIGARDKGECATGEPGSKAVAGKSTVCAGTWESRHAPQGSCQEAEKAMRRNGMAAVGPIHNRGVMRAMPHEEAYPLEGIGSLTLGSEDVNAIH